MTEADLRQRVWRHNALQIASGIAMAVLALCAWPISFWLLRFVVHAPLALLEIPNSAGVSFYAAAAGTFLLALEGIRYWRLIRADQENVVGTEFRDDMLAASVTGRGLGAWHMYITEGYLAVHLMLFAPRVTAQLLYVPRCLIYAPADAFPQAAEVYRRLAEDRRWTPVSEHRDRGAGVILLDRLQLIWTRIEDGQLQLRIPPGST
jgi:hypothetical protein